MKELELQVTGEPPLLYPSESGGLTLKKGKWRVLRWRSFSTVMNGDTMLNIVKARGLHVIGDAECTDPEPSPTIGLPKHWEQDLWHLGRRLEDSTLGYVTSPTGKT